MAVDGSQRWRRRQRQRRKQSQSGRAEARIRLRGRPIAASAGSSVYRPSEPLQQATLHSQYDGGTLPSPPDSPARTLPSASQPAPRLLLPASVLLSVLAPAPQG